MKKKIKIEIEMVEGDSRVVCALWSQNGAFIDYNKLKTAEKERIVESLEYFAKLFRERLR